MAEEDISGLEAVGDGVAGSNGLAFGSKGTAGERAIAAGSFDLFVGTHGVLPRSGTRGSEGVGERAQRPYLVEFWQRGQKNESIIFCK